MNNHTDENIAFFLVEIKLYQIGSSDIAVKFEVVEKPNDWTKEIKRNTSNSPTLQARYDYWVAFNDYEFQNNAFAKQFNKRKASTDHWMTFSVGSSACHISMSQIRKYNHPTIYRIDRIQEYTVLDEKFHIPYSSRFEEGEFRKRIQFMYGGKIRKVKFAYSGDSLEAILDRLPTAKLIDEEDGKYILTAEVFGKGIDMWLCSQGDLIKIIE